MGLTISTSKRPPTICLQNHLTPNRPIFIRPTASSAPVLCASFHPMQTHLFLLAFADQTLAIYDYNRILRQAGRSNDLRKPSGGEQTGEIGHLNLQHARDRKVNKSSPDQRNAPIPTGDSNIVLNSREIRGAQFLPTDKLQVAVIADDGQCYIVDFGNGQNKAQIVQSWHNCAPGTSLAILEAQEDGAGTGTNCYIAIGRDDGKVSIFSSSGQLLAQKLAGPPGNKIVNIDWIRSGSGPTSSKPQRKNTAQYQSSQRPDGQVKKSMARHENVPSGKSNPEKPSIASLHTKSLKAGNAKSNSERDNAGEYTEDAPSTQRKAESDRRDAESSWPKGNIRTSKAIDWQDVIEPYSTNYMEFFSPVKLTLTPKYRQKAATLPKPKTRTTGSLRIKELANGSICEVSSTKSAPQIWEDMPVSPKRNAPPPPIPPRFTQRKRRRISMPKVEPLATKKTNGDPRQESLPQASSLNSPNKNKTWMDKTCISDVGLKASKQHRSSRVFQSRSRSLKSNSDTTKGSHKTVSFDEPYQEENLATSEKRNTLSKITIHEDSEELYHQIATPPRQSSIKSRQQTPRTRRTSADEPNILSPSRSTNTRSHPGSASKHEAENCACQSPNYLHLEVAKLRASMKRDMSAFQFDLKKQLLAQKLVFEDILAIERAERRALKREVELLRRDIAEKEKGPGGLLVGL
jgi:hypothetical protein